jgi:coenzyme F420-reducing hydrogenase beta subunit
MHTIAEVVETKACSGCGMCAAVCPVGAITIEEGYRPLIGDDCSGCEICYEACPRVEMPYSAIEQGCAERNRALDHDELLGYYTRIFLARAAEEKVRNAGYSGGTTTAFIRYLLDQGMIDAALLTDRAHLLPYCAHPKPRVAVNAQEALECAFTKPTVNPLLARLPVPGDRVAVVGNACHMEALRKAQWLAADDTPAGRRCRELVGNIRFLVGLTCFFSNNPRGVDILLAGINLKESDLKRWFYDHGNPAVELLDGTVKRVPGANRNFSALNLGCLLCYPSYTARLSDVTFGKTMSDEWGWNDVICRNRDVDDMLAAMEKGQLIETREAEDRGGELLATLLEAGVFHMDAAGYAHYLEKGDFSIDETTADMLENRPGGTIRGISLMKLIQAVRRYAFYESAVAARRARNVFVPEYR